MTDHFVAIPSLVFYKFSDFAHCRLEPICSFVCGMWVN